MGVVASFAEIDAGVAVAGPEAVEGGDDDGCEAELGERVGVGAGVVDRRLEGRKDLIFRQREFGCGRPWKIQRLGSILRRSLEPQPVVKNVVGLAR